MKNSIILLSFLSLILFGCSKESTPPLVLSVSPSQGFVVDFEEQSLRIEIQSGSEWALSGLTAWCVPERVSGTGSGAVTITVAPNISGQERVANLTVTNRQESKTIRITQGASAQEYQFKIPVVFHVLYTNPSNLNQNIPAEWIYQLLAQSNQAFKGSMSSPDMAVEFIPATHNPSGKALAEVGINRILWDRSLSMDCNVFMKDKENVNYLWNPSKYINIFVYSFTNENVLGVSFLPYTVSSNALEGLYPGDRYLVDQTLTYPHSLSLNNLFFYAQHRYLKVPYMGLTLAHELGHYLGLFHVFSEEGSLTDYCADTDTYDRKEYDEWLDSLTTALTFDRLAQRTDPGGKTFTSYNRMDYDYSYLNRFTSDQKIRIRHVLENSPLVPGPKRSSGVAKGAVDMSVPDARIIE